jgi:hypothetical protein
MSLSVPPRSGDLVKLSEQRPKSSIAKAGETRRQRSKVSLRTMRLIQSVVEPMESRVLMDGVPFLSAPVSYPVPGDRNFPVYVADVNGDGLPDIIAPYSAPTSTTGVHDLGGISVLIGNGDGTFGLASNQATFNHGLAAVEGDVNGDGIPDVVQLDSYHNYSTTPAFFESDLGQYGAGSLPPAAGKFYFNTAAASNLPNTAAANLATTFALGDVNGDGLPDIVAAYGYGNSIGVQVGNGDGTFTAATQHFAVGSRPDAVAVADLRSAQAVSLAGNVINDVVVANQLSNTVTVLVGSGRSGGGGGGGAGTVSFGTEYTFPVGNSPVAVAVADINGDGIPDIITANAGDNTISVLFGNGNGTFKPATTIAVGADPVSLAIGDISGNGSNDIVTANAVDQSLTLLTNNGDGTFAPGQTIALNAIPIAVTTADLSSTTNVDTLINPSDTTPGGRLDLIVTSTTTGGFGGALTPQSNQVQIIMNTNRNQPGISVNNGVVNINGTDGSDAITLTSDGTSLTALVNNSQQVIPLASITQINVYGLGGDDSITIGPGVPAVFAGGGGGNDTIAIENSANNIMRGGAGDDLINLRAGLDGNTVGASGNNFVSGGKGNDTLFAGTGNDTLNGNTGDDSIVGGPGNDYLSGGPDNDTIIASFNIVDNGIDTIIGGAGDDSVAENIGDLVLVGSGGNDTVTEIP